VPIASDLLTEGSETLTVTVQGQTASTVINDTSKAAVPAVKLETESNNTYSVANLIALGETVRGDLKLSTDTSTDWDHFKFQVSTPGFYEFYCQWTDQVDPLSVQFRTEEASNSYVKAPIAGFSFSGTPNGREGYVDADRAKLILYLDQPGIYSLSLSGSNGKQPAGNYEFAINALPAVSASLVSGPTIITEGQNLDLTFSIKGVSPGDYVSFYTRGLSGSDVILAGDGWENGQVGLVQVSGSGTAVIRVPIRDDSLVEGVEALDVHALGIKHSVSVLDKVSTSGYQIAAVSASVNEGSSASFTLATTNVAAGTSVPYTLSGVSSSDIVGGALTGTATVDSSGRATISVPIASDLLTEGSETLAVTVQGQTASTTINDTSKTAAATYALTSSSSSVNEGSSASFTLATTNVAAGTSVPYTLSGVSSSDIVGGALTGTATVDSSGRATISVPIASDLLTEGSETLAVTVQGQTASTVINDTSKAEGVSDDSLYQFFFVAFGAAPGTTYYSQMKEAIGFGLSLKEVVNIFTTKQVFTDSYPISLSNADFASRIVENVVGTSAAQSSKNSAVAEIKAALDIGWTRGDIVYQLFTNIEKLGTADPIWGVLNLKMSKKVEVARYVTEVMADKTEDVLILRGYLSKVTESTDVSTASKIADIVNQSRVSIGVQSDTLSTDEGGSVVFTLVTTNVAVGTSVPYTLSGVSSSDIVGGALSGTATVDSSGRATISVSIASDQLTEGSETLTVTVQGQTASTVINDTSKTAAATYALISSSSSVNEGSSASFTLDTTNVAAGTSVPYTLSGVSSSDIVGGALTGTATVDSSGRATISVPIASDQLTEGSETLTVTAQGQTASTVINDTSLNTPTDKTPPILLSMTPTPGSRDVSVDELFRFIFDEKLNLREDLVLFRDSLGSPLEIDLLLGSGGADFSIDPAGSLDYDTVYSVVFQPGAITDLFGNPFPFYDFFFTTIQNPNDGGGGGGGGG
jgi:plastocyanin